MQLTAQTRLTLDAASQQLDAYARHYAKHLHKLYAWLAKRGGAVKSHKTEFCHRFGISARFFNALALELQGLLRAPKSYVAAENRKSAGQLGLCLAGTSNTLMRRG